jgi:hypothetical protein
VVSYYDTLVEVHQAARKHGFDDPDIAHAIDNALSIDEVGEDKLLYLGPARDGRLLEVVTLRRQDGPELAIHAMKMREKYKRLLP